MERNASSVTLDELGWSPDFARDVSFPLRDGRSPARVLTVHSARAHVWTAEGQRLASVRSRALRDAPIEGGLAVGDWVVVAPVTASEREQEVVIERVLPRRTVFLRQAAGERSEPQAIAANLDRVFVVTSVDADFNLRRLERYLVAIGAGGAQAEIVLTKADLESDLEAIADRARALAPTLVTSARSGLGLDALRDRIGPAMTVALVGSSGVGKSALVNRLLGRDVQLEGAVREHDKRGRHTTTRRELFLLPGGGLLVDTPGLRELKPWLPKEEVTETFDDVAEAALRCRYRDCGHASEPGCAVRAAVEVGELARERFAAWQKLEQEREVAAPRQQASGAVSAKRRATAERQRAIAIGYRKLVRDRGR
jgi:ribosome biogenesis GTPase / thiamine phosphate phosphatase